MRADRFVAVVVDLGAKALVGGSVMVLSSISGFPRKRRGQFALGAARSSVREGD